MPASRVYVTQLDGGLDDNIATSLIDEKCASDLLNVKWNGGKVLMKRDGFIDVGPTLTSPRCLGQLNIPAGKKILAIDGSNLKMTDSQFASWITVSNLTFNTAATQYQIQQIKDKAIIWDRLDPGTVFDGTTLTRPGTLPNGGFSVYFQGYTICGGVPGKESRLYISTVANSFDFTNSPGAITDGVDPDSATEVPGATVFEGVAPDLAQFIDISPSDGEPITLLHEYQDLLIIGKLNSLWSMTFDTNTNDPTIQLITRSVGCVNNDTAVSVNNDLYLMSDQGPLSLGNERNYVSALRTNLLGDKIKQLIDNINREQWKKTTAVFYDKMFILSVPTNGSDTINTILMLDTRFGGWSVWDTINAKAWLSHLDSDNKRHLYFIQEGWDSVSEIVPNYYYDRTNAITAYWKSKALDAGALDITKRWTYLTLFMRNIGSSAKLMLNTELETLPTMDVFEGLSANGLGFNQYGVSSWYGVQSDSNNGNENSISSSDDAWRTDPQLESRTLTLEVFNDVAGENFFFAGFAAEYKLLGAYYFDQSHTF